MASGVQEVRLIAVGTWTDKHYVNIYKCEESNSFKTGSSGNDFIQVYTDILEIFMRVEENLLYAWYPEVKLQNLFEIVYENSKVSN